jgi:excisionase family DNA binding protein
VPYAAEELLYSPSMLTEEQRDPAHLTPKEVAASWRCHPDTVLELLRSGELPGFKIGRVWRVKVEDVREYERGKG